MIAVGYGYLQSMPMGKFFDVLFFVGTGAGGTLLSEDTLLHLGLPQFGTVTLWNGISEITEVYRDSTGIFIGDNVLGRVSVLGLLKLKPAFGGKWTSDEESVDLLEIPAGSHWRLSIGCEEQQGGDLAPLCVARKTNEEK